MQHFNPQVDDQDLQDPVSSPIRFRFDVTVHREMVVVTNDCRADGAAASMSWG